MICKDNIKAGMELYLGYEYNKNFQTATSKEIYYALVCMLMPVIREKWEKTKKEFLSSNEKVLYYFSFEWLLGRLLGNTIIGMTEQKEIRELLVELNLDLNEIEAQEQDVNLGYGGQGRTAACMMDSCATQGYPAYGCGMRFQYGVEQRIQDGYSINYPDEWLKGGYPLETCCESETIEIQIGDTTILAVPYDIPIVGYGNNRVNTLRLWSAKVKNSFNLDELPGELLIKALQEEQLPKIISELLLPQERYISGKRFRLKQQYFFVSASVQWAVKQHMEKYNTIYNFHEKNVFQLNDDRSALAVVELLRILLNEYQLSWESAWHIMSCTCAYTVHTMNEIAQEKWPLEIISEELPSIYPIIVETARHLNSVGAAVIEDNMVQMNVLAAYACFSVNGVSKQHTEYLMYQQLSNLYRRYPGKFHNKSNGVTHRRFLLHANPLLADWITKKIGREWITDPQCLRKLAPYAEDPSCQQESMDIRYQNKIRLSEYIKNQTGIQVDPASIFLAQTKRMYSYKRHYMNVLYIEEYYQQIKNHPEMDVVPKTFILSGKPETVDGNAGSRMVKLIHEMADKINSDRALNGKIKLVYLPDYRVSLSELIISAADINLQISIPGKEASATSALKYMFNGALTVGTKYGTVAEISRELGEKFMFLFNEQLSETSDSSEDGVFARYALGDLEEAQKRAEEQYRNQEWWAKAAIQSISCAGVFSTDCVVRAYNKDVWHCF